MKKFWMTIAVLVLTLTSPCFSSEPTKQASDNPLYDFFPFGMYLSGPNPVFDIAGDLAAKAEFTCADMKAHKFNCVWANNLDIGSQGDAWLTAGEKNGVRIILQGGGAPDLLRLEPPCAPQGSFENRDYLDNTLLPRWITLATKYRNRLALLAYSLDEECPPYPTARYKVLDRVTRLVEAIDPAHPAIVCYNKITSAELGADMVKPKAITSDWYPFFSDTNSGPHTRAGSLSYYTINQERAYRAARKSGGPFWIMGLGSELTTLVKGRADKPTYRMPGPNEIRWQVWCSLYCGAKGVFFYLYSYDNFERPEFPTNAVEGAEMSWAPAMVDRKGKESAIYREAALVSREIESLKPLFLKLDWAEPEDNVVYWIESEYVVGRTFVHRDTGARYLVLFNSDAEKPHPAAVELNRFGEEVGLATKTYDVRGRKPLTSEWPDKELKELMIGPGDGAVVLIQDKPDTLEKHKAQYEK